MPAGRPTVLTPEVKRKIADCFLVAFTDEQTAAIVGIHERTIRRMRAGEYCPEVKKAEYEREFKYRMKVWNAKYLPAGICWMLERKYASQFAKPEVQLQINTTNQTVNNTLIITAEAAQGISTRVKEADVKIEKLLKDKRPGHNGNGAKSSSPEAKK
jgi:hypothetical protein